MGPSKFIAPLKKSGLSSLSGFSSGCSSGSESQGVNSAQAEQDKAASCSGFKAPNESLKSNASKTPEQVGTKSADHEISKSSTSSDEPPQKKMRSDSAPKLSNVIESSDKNLSIDAKDICPPESKKSYKPPVSSCNGRIQGSDSTNRANDDKENICPAKSKKSDKPAKPVVSLTDEDYERIFDAVMRRPLDNVTEKSDALDHSKDMFEFSQSDLDDSEGEQLESTTNKVTSVKGNNDTPAVNPCHTACDTNQESKSVAHTLGDPSSCILTSVQLKSKNDTKESRTMTLEELTNKVDSKSPTEDGDSQGTSVMDFETLQYHSTPQVEKRTLQPNSDNFIITPQKTNYPQNVLRLSQEQNRSPASMIKAAATPLSQQSQVSETVSSPLKAPLSTSTSQPLLVAPGPTSTPKQTTLSQRSHSFQGPNTPACTPTRKSSFIPKNSEPLHTPIKSSLATDAGSPIPNTPSGSQQISQEICLTPPPSEKTAKERLLWLQKKRLAGLWVQCDERECQKWRYLNDCHDPTTLPDKWFCSMHPDGEFNCCDAPEKRLSLHAEEDMIFNKYSPGSLVWAKLSGYPWWPAMVEDDPDLEQFYWLNEFSDIPTWYHVVFFDDEDRTSRYRAWVQLERLREFNEEPLDNEGVELIGYKKRVKLAHKVACQAKALNPDQRLAQYSFASCYKGPIGGPATRKYNGPVGFREPVSK